MYSMNTLNSPQQPSQNSPSLQGLGDIDTLPTGIIPANSVYGNRYYTEDVSIKILFERKDLESYIIENYPQKDIIDMTKIIKLNEQETLVKNYEVDEIRDLESKIKINPVIKENYRFIF